MKIALIPPKGLEGFALHSKFHLSLPLPETMRNPNYVNVYQRAKRGGDYIVMDNGIAEAAKLLNSELIASAAILGADEFVLPDVIRDYRKTVERVKLFFTQYGAQAKEVGLNKFMAVAQGTDRRQVTSSIKSFADIEQITCIGLPRHLLQTTGTTNIRIDIANWIKANFDDRFEIHLLGADAASRKEIRWAATYAEHIRSIDSSLPFNYALAGYSLDSVGTIVRPDAYFTRAWGTMANVELVKHNIQIFKRWANGEQSVGEKASSGEVRGVSSAGRREVRSLPNPFNA